MPDAVGRSNRWRSGPPLILRLGSRLRPRRPQPESEESWTPPTWEELVRDHGARVYRLAYRLTGNPHDAEDLTQDVFVRVFRSLHRFQPGTFEGWLHRITTNLFLDGARRRQKIRFDGLGDGSAERLPSAWPNPSDQLADADLDHDVAAALSALPPEFRAAVVLCDIEGLSYEEISEVLDIKIGTVRSRIHRGRAQLRTALAHRRPTGERLRYLGVEVEAGEIPDSVPRSGGDLQVGKSGAGEVRVRKAPCAELAELRSAFVDGALSDADRERLLQPPRRLRRLPARRRGSARRTRAAQPDQDRTRACAQRSVAAPGFDSRSRIGRSTVDKAIPPYPTVRFLPHRRSAKSPPQGQAPTHRGARRPLERRSPPSALSGTPLRHV